ncbi:hypothetical protein [Salinispira pacifica]|uniref:hypothetical protein n=1 Tax=Salinispira pacifica TaxID=1307761 RepID=UPI00059DE66F|nr:hypothetical protein [Salinispira pacifica]
MIIFGVIVWIIFTVLVAKVAGERNRSVGGWVFISFFISPLIAIFVLAVLGKAKTSPSKSKSYTSSPKEHFYGDQKMYPNAHKNTASGGNPKYCKKCQTTNEPTALSCKGCGEFL